MRESFRSTTPIAELAVNVLHRLTHSDERQDQNELMGIGLIAKTQRNGEEWLRVRFNQIELKLSGLFSASSASILRFMRTPFFFIEPISLE